MQFQPAIDEMLSLLPDQVHSFQGSEYALPVKAAILGNREIHPQAVRQELVQVRDSDVKELLEPVLLAAELYEASCEDRDRYFLTDRKVQSCVFTGAKWRAGWVLVLGQDQTELVAQLQERDFMVFTDSPDIPNTVYIGSRSTSPIYFAQLMVRYGLIWGGIAPGDDHEMSHFLEKDMPGLIVIHTDLPPLKYLVTLGLMKLGAPAIVPPTFPFPYGNRVTAQDSDEVLDRLRHFPNLRQRYYRDEIIRLPDFCNPAFAAEQFDADQRLGGRPDSFFCVRPAAQVGQRVAIVGRPANDIGLLVEIAHERLSDDVAYTVEKTAIRAISYLSGVRAYEESGRFHIELAKGVAFDPQQVADAIYWGIRVEYPRLQQIAVRLVFDPALLASQAKDVTRYKRERQQFIQSMTEHNTDVFVACTECRPFSLVHTCIATPERPPMCAARTYASIKAAAYLGSAQVPWSRASEGQLPMRLAFRKGQILDAERGEYEGSNQVYRALTHGQLQRVYLHSLRDYPHTSCGCFQALAFWMDDVDRIGIMLRDSTAATPGGQTWAELANRAGGKASPGILGVSLAYVRSPHFLQGDGGIGAVAWVDSALYDKIHAAFLPGQRVATEKEVQTMAELRAFLTA